MIETAPRRWFELPCRIAVLGGLVSCGRQPQESDTRNPIRGRALVQAGRRRS